MTENRYSAGLLFRGDHVLLVQKILPTWQKGLYNAIGGKVEKNENYHACQRREFREETGLDVKEWTLFAIEEGRDYKVSFYTAQTTNVRWSPHDVNDVGEKIRWFILDEIGRSNCRVVGNLRWLIPLALDWRDHDTVIFRTEDSIKDNPTW